MELTTQHQASIYKGIGHVIGAIPTKAFRLHNNLRNVNRSVRFYDKYGNSMLFSGNEICTNDTLNQQGARLNVGEAGQKYSLIWPDDLEKFREMFQYDVSKKNEVLIEIVSIF